jgi:hypothetical protein
MKMQPAVVADHVIAFLMITLLRVIAGVAGIQRGAIYSVGAFDNEESDRLVVREFIVEELRRAAQV